MSPRPSTQSPEGEFFTTARAEGGTGLGLAIARAIVTGAGGSLAIIPGSTGAHLLVCLPSFRVQ